MKGHLNDKATETYVEIKKFMSVKLQCPFTISDNIKPVLRKLLHNLQKKWQQVPRNEGKFLQKFSEWLRVFVSFKETKQSSEKSRDLDRYSSEFAESRD